MKPRVWTAEQLAADARISAARFRDERLAVTGDWARHVEPAVRKFDLVLRQLGSVQGQVLAEADLLPLLAADLREALRYLAGPPISDDDLKAVAALDSVAPSRLKADPAALQRVRDVMLRLLDPYRFPWIAEGREPSQAERSAAITASAVLLAAQRIATERRMSGKDQQEQALRAFLSGQGMMEVPPAAIMTLVQGPQAGQFCGECKLGQRKADVVVRLYDTRLMAIECKVSNSALNSIKRVNNDAAAKAAYWLQEFGSAQVVPAALLAGVFDVHNLVQAQDRGLVLFWSHALSPLAQFIGSTRP